MELPQNTDMFLKLRRTGSHASRRPVQPRPNPRRQLIVTRFDP